MVLRISVNADERRAAASGDGITGKENLDWKKITPEGLQAESLLKPVDDMPESVVKEVQAAVTEEVCRKLGWFFRLQPGGNNPIIVDVLEDQKGKLLAVLQWKYDQMRLSGQGGHGQVWNEARGTFNLKGDASQILVEAMAGGVELERMKIKERAEIHAAMQDAELDDATIVARQEECLRAAGLDWETIRNKQRELADRLMNRDDTQPE